MKGVWPTHSPDELAHLKGSRVFNFEFSESNILLVNEQFGSRTKRSKIEAITNLNNEVSRALDGSQRTRGVFCDLSRAFDCVNHDILLRNFEAFNFSNKSVSWIRAFLEQLYKRSFI